MSQMIAFIFFFSSQLESVILFFFFLFSSFQCIFVLNDRARCQQQIIICIACYGACLASQLLLQFWITLAYAKLAGLKSALHEFADLSVEPVLENLRKWLLPFFSWWWLFYA